MMKKILSIATVALFLSAPVFAQDAKEEDPGYYGSITINSDSFFGLTPIAAIGVPIADGIDITGYAIFWSGIGNNAAFGHWTEFGGGVNFSLMDGALNINPQLGVLNGNLLSRGGGAAPIFAEGIVPNITVLFEQNGFELEFYYGYYMGTKGDPGAITSNAGSTTFSQVDPDIALLAALPAGSEALGALQLAANKFPNKNAVNNFTHVWLFKGYQITDWLSVGLHYEELQSRASGGIGDAPNVLYTWRGLYATLKAGKGSLRVAAGNSSAQVDGPDALDILTIAAGGRTAAIDYLNDPAPGSAMNGTYYRVTYTQEF
ncbi:MAG: hypothetical protein JJT78_15820 [Leptospira sp.]|nr:hypothetical protein [Leptospira sp.]